MRIRVSDPALVDDLLAFLERRPSCVVTRDEDRDDEVELNLLGSLSSRALDLEIDLLLRTWEMRHPGVHARTIGVPG